MVPIDARELFVKEYTNPFAGVKIAPPLLIDLSESEDSFYVAQSPLNRSEGEIGGDQYLQKLGSFKQPEPGMARNTKLGQTRGYSTTGGKGTNEPIYDSSEGPLPKKSNQVYQSADSFGKSKFGQRQQIKEDFLEDDMDESGEIDPSLFV